MTIIVAGAGAVGVAGWDEAEVCPFGQAEDSSAVAVREQVRAAD